MCIEPTGNSPRPPSAAESAAGPLVALLGPALDGSTIPQRLREAGATPVPLGANAAPDGQAAHLIAALSCDVAVVELSAAVGLDATTAQLWQCLSWAGMPRVVVVSGLGSTGADFDDVAAIAQRALGEECVPVRLPVFGDDNELVASLDLCRAALDTAEGQLPAEAGHLQVAAGDMSALVSVVAASVADDAAAETYMGVLDRLSDNSPTEPGNSGATVGLGMPTLGQPRSSLPDGLADTLPDRLADDVRDFVAEGILAPIVADSPDGAWIADVKAWSATPSRPADRLVRRDAHGDPADGWAGVVLAFDGDTALIREVFGQPTPGYALITAVGTTAAGEPVPHRAWPTDLQLAEGSTGPTEVPTSRWTSSVRMSVGDTVAAGHVWLVPAQ